MILDVKKHDNLSNGFQKGALVLFIFSTNRGRFPILQVGNFLSIRLSRYKCWFSSRLLLKFDLPF